MFYKNPVLNMLLLLMVLPLACGKEDTSEWSGKIVQNDRKSEIALEFQKAYRDNNLSSVKHHFSEKAVFSVNDSKLSFDEVNAGFSDGHNYFDNITHSNEIVTTMYYNNGQVYTNLWYDWSGVSKATDETLVIRGYATFKWKEDKIVEAYNAFDPTLYNKEMAPD